MVEGSRAFAQGHGLIASAWSSSQAAVYLGVPHSARAPSLRAHTTVPMAHAPTPTLSHAPCHQCTRRHCAGGLPPRSARAGPPRHTGFRPGARGLPQSACAPLPWRLRPPLGRTSPAFPGSRAPQRSPQCSGEDRKSLNRSAALVSAFLVK